MMGVGINDTSRHMERAQIELLRKTGLAGRFMRMQSLSRSVIGLSRRAICRRNPQMSEREQKLAFVALHYGAEFGKRVREYLRRRETV